MLQLIPERRIELLTRYPLGTTAYPLWVISKPGLYVANDVGPFTEVVSAPIANVITALHLILWDALLVAMGLHVLAIVVYAAAKGHNLVLPMVTGWKILPDSVSQPRMVGASRTVLLLAFSVAAAAAIANCL